MKKNTQLLVILIILLIGIAIGGTTLFKLMGNQESDRGKNSSSIVEVETQTEEVSRDGLEIDFGTSSGTDSQEDDSSNKEDSQNEEDSQIAESEVSPSTSDYLLGYLNNTLIPEYGVFQSPQTGTMHSSKDCWLNNKGIWGYMIYDFDQDGKEELLIIRTIPLEEDTSVVEAKYLSDYMKDPKSFVTLFMYEEDDGEVKEAARQPMYPYGTPGPWMLSDNNLESELVGITILSNDTSDYPYILFEGQSVNALTKGDADGIDSMGFIYNGKNFQYAMSCSGYFYQTNVHVFDAEGQWEKKTTYYSNIDSSGKYGDPDTAMSKYYADYGITITKYQSLKERSFFQDNDGIVASLILRNKCIENRSGGSKIDATFECSLDANGLVILADESKADTENTTSDQTAESSGSNSDENSASREVFSQAAGHFTYSSGAGAWGTELDVNADGSFYGEFHDSNMYELLGCRFSGKFSDPVKVDDYCYSVTVESLDRWDLDESMREGYETYALDGPAGLNVGDQFELYLPGYPIENIDTSSLSYGQSSMLTYYSRSSNPPGLMMNLTRDALFIQSTQ